MNKTRRDEIEKAAKLLNEAKEILETAKDEEEEYKYSIPDNMQGSDRYEIAESAVDALDSAISSLEDAILSTEEASN